VPTTGDCYCVVLPERCCPARKPGRSTVNVVSRGAYRDRGALFCFDVIYTAVVKIVLSFSPCSAPEIQLTRPLLKHRPFVECQCIRKPQTKSTQPARAWPQNATQAFCIHNEPFQDVQDATVVSGAGMLLSHDKPSECCADKKLACHVNTNVDMKITKQLLFMRT
jgi:hypothetical protein